MNSIPSLLIPTPIYSVRNVLVMFGPVMNKLLLVRYLYINVGNNMVLYPTIPNPKKMKPLKVLYTYNQTQIKFNQSQVKFSALKY